jgi:hypothetical protein
VCHQCTPVAPEELENWLHDQVDRLQSSVPELIVRLSRLTQGLPDSDVVGGWLIELELVAESPRNDQLADVLADVLTDMRFLGMQPKLMRPAWAKALDETFSESPARISQPVFDYPGLY